jgi:SAM-dependent methyltransferase
MQPSVTGSSEAWADWLSTPPGRYLAEWEQAQFNRVVADVFGYHALQLGTASMDALGCNRMPHRWLVGEGLAAGGPAHHVQCQLDALPFQSQSLDLVVLPHTLELSPDPHQTLREVERVLVPGGRVIVSGFNRASLWGLAERAGWWRRRLGSTTPGFLPDQTHPIGHRRLRDWMKLLSIHVEGGRFGCYAIPARTEAWLQRTAWMEPTGDRWWPVFGAVYLLVAVKRVPGSRMVGLARRAPAKRRAAVAAPADVRQHRPQHGQVGEPLKALDDDVR